jgi:two-component system chemotaxis sensor kinase CheA
LQIDASAEQIGQAVLQLLVSARRTGGRADHPSPALIEAARLTVWTPRCSMEPGMTPQEIQDIFFVECEESLAAAERVWPPARPERRIPTRSTHLPRGPFDQGRRGRFRLCGLQAFTHVFETLLSDVREGAVPITAPLVDLMLRALDVLSDHVAAARDGAAPEDAALLKELRRRWRERGRSPAPVAAPPRRPPNHRPTARMTAPATISTSTRYSTIWPGQPRRNTGRGGRMAGDAAPHAASMRNGRRTAAAARNGGLGALCRDCDGPCAQPRRSRPASGLSGLDLPRAP